ncbi:Retinoic acid induced 16-like protein-domain-containing protein [Blakeslea trispora]|nr:Retinoic acid induced 16-like protein-domain-containing protein [Blakeslea trispora]
MDYFSKFKKRIAPPKAQPTSAMQLAKFHKYWEYVHNIFVLDDRKANMHVQQTEIPSKLRQMVDLLVDEEARQEDNTTGLCMEYFLKNGVLQYLVTIAEKEDYPVGIRGEAIRTVASMIDLLDDRFLVHNAVHKPTIKLLRFCVLDDRQSDLYSDDLVDLMYIICSKIHGFPALLNIFFHDKHWLTTPQKNTTVSNFVKESEEEDQQVHEYEFLLFTYLLRFVHREGRSGDFARTGLLFLVEMATDQLGDFMLGSDFATILAAGLGALYSQLPRKLIVKDEAEHIYATPTSYLLGQDELDEESHASRFPSTLGAEYSNSPEFRYQLDSFLKLLEFCQDVLMRCPNQDILASLLANIRANFLENILYPSIIECNDLDGSSVAVISYIDLILQTIQQEDLAKVVVGFLMNDEEPTDDLQDIVSQTEQIQIEPRRPSISTYITLKDLIFGRLECNSQSTVIATLKLLKTLITKHCQYSLSLLSIYPDTNKSPMIISHHLREVELYFSLVIAIDAQHAQEVLNCGYEEYLRDVEQSIDLDGCYQNIRSAHDPTLFDRLKETPKAKKRRSFKYGQRHHEEKEEEAARLEEQKRRQKKHMTRHCVRSTDRLLQILLNLLSHFFTQSSELNLALTGVIAALAMCPYRSLEGWISFSEQDRTHRDDILILNSSDTTATQRQSTQIQNKSTQEAEDDDDDRSVDFGVERESSQKTMPTFFKSYPPFFTLLRTLTQQVDYYRSEIQTFDQLLEERRHALISGEASLDGTKRATTSAVSSPPPVSYSRRPSVLRPMETPQLTPSVSSSTTTRTNMSTVLNNPMSPLTMHIKKTSNTRIQPLFPSNFINEREEPILDLDDEDEHMFAPKLADPSQQKRLDKSTEITLSTLLNNVVILEESIKELVALMQVRRGLGIDEIAYV